MRSAMPDRIVLGVGCDRGTSWLTVDAAIRHALAIVGMCHEQVDSLASIDIKGDEAGLLVLAAWNDWPFRLYPAATLARVKVPHPSETVRRHIGTPSVSEAAALLAAHAGPDALVLEKLKWRGSDGRHATVSIARVAAPAADS